MTLSLFLPPAQICSNLPQHTSKYVPVRVEVPDITTNVSQSEHAACNDNVQDIGVLLRYLPIRATAPAHCLCGY